MPITSDTTSLDYWLNWRVLVCAIWVSTPMAIAIYMIWKYEQTEIERRRNQQHIDEDEPWRPSLREIHPFWLLGFRIFAFLVLSTTLIWDIFIVHDLGMLNYYTEWTLVLVTIYFGLGSCLSIYGLCQRYGNNPQSQLKNEVISTEQGIYVPLRFEEGVYKVILENNSSHQSKSGFFSMTTLRRAFQVIFQMTGGAVMLTDCVYWLVIFPFLTVKDYEMSMLTILTHSINAVLLVGDIVLNCLPLPWFRISYFLLLTGIYVFVQWIVHAFIPLPWPYPFLDLSAENAPIWYLLVALLHIPCYGLCTLIVDLKHYILSRWFTLSYQGLR